MNNSFLLFAIKCTCIVYFAACTRIENLTDIRSATPLITKGTWKIVMSGKNNAGQAASIADYKLVFGSNGVVKALRNGTETSGNWSEDNFAKRITLNFGMTDPTLQKLNDYWTIRDIANLEVNLQNNHSSSMEDLKLLHFN